MSTLRSPVPLDRPSHRSTKPPHRFAGQGLDGDGQYQANRPNGSTVRKIAAAAAEQNMVLAVPVSPDKSTRTWWRDGETNGEWVRSLINKVVDEEDVDRNRIHLIGYSGGAQEIANELLADNPSGWMLGGGATIIGGGGPGGRLEDPPSGELAANLDVRWYTNQTDVAGATESGNWSALADARRGAQAYQDAGVEKAEQVTLDGRGHSYDLADLAAQDLERLYSDTSESSTQQDDDPQDNNDQQPSTDRQERVGQMPQIVERQRSAGEQARDGADEQEPLQNQDREGENQGQQNEDNDRDQVADRAEDASVDDQPAEDDRSLREALWDLLTRTDSDQDQQQTRADDGTEGQADRERTGQQRSADATGQTPDRDAAARTPAPRNTSSAEGPGGQDPDGDIQQDRDTPQDREQASPTPSPSRSAGQDTGSRDQGGERAAGDVDEQRSGEGGRDEASAGDRAEGQRDADQQAQRSDAERVQEENRPGQPQSSPSASPDRSAAAEDTSTRDEGGERAAGDVDEQDRQENGSEEPSEQTVAVWESLRDLLRRVGVD